MKKMLELAYAGIAYLLAMANIGYIAGFLAGFGVPRSVNTGRFDGDLWSAVTIDALLVLGFGLHHSVTARRSFKRWWTKFVPPHLERATYLYMTAAMTTILVLAWKPVPVTVWQVQAPWAVVSIHGAFLAVLLVMFAATFQFGHLGFFGVAQVLDRIRAKQPAGPSLSARYLYAIVRHPISVGWMAVPWLTPHLTVGQLAFAASVAVYVLVATAFEEADLVAEFGDLYRRYRKEVPAFIPWI